LPALLVVIIASIADNLIMDKVFLQKFAIRVKEIRKAKGLVQDDLDSDRISRSTVSNIEIARNDITLTKIKALADGLGVEVKELFDFK